MLPEEIAEKTVFINDSTGLTSTVVDGLNPRLTQKLKRAFSVDKPGYVYMHNFHPFLNYHVAKLSKGHGATFIQHVQEPYVEDKSIYGGLHQYWLHLFEYLQGRLLEKTDVAVISSDEALSLFEKRYPDFGGKKARIPLMYEDLGGCTSNKNERKYITFIGPPVPAKGTETFLEVVDYSEKHDLGFNFLLISHAKIDDQRYYRNGNLQILYKPKITDKEIGDHLQRSLMTITPYRTARQSSVILTSYMYGTPVISTNVGGLPEIVSHLKTGYLLDKDSKVEEWIEGINFIRDNLLEMSKNCRSYFVENFSEVNWPRYFGEIFQPNANRR